MIKKNPRSVSFTSASTVSSADEMLGRLLAFRPIDVRSVATSIGESEATVCQVVDVNDGTPIDLGERLIFWQVVRHQLAKSAAEAPWVAGRLVQTGQAYRLEPLEGPEVPRVQTALDALEALNA